MFSYAGGCKVWNVLSRARDYTLEKFESDRGVSIREGACAQSIVEISYLFCVWVLNFNMSECFYAYTMLKLLTYHNEF